MDTMGEEHTTVSKVKITKATFGLRLLLVLVGCGFSVSPQAFSQSRTGDSTNTPQANPGSVRSIPEDFATILIAPGFLLNVQVYGEPDLSTAARVDSDGEVALPLVGKVDVNRLTASQAEDRISYAYQKKAILLHPSVTLNIQEYAGGWVSVTGEVNHPGKIELLAPHSLLDVLSAAGGRTEFASSEIDILRGLSHSPEVLKIGRNGSVEALRRITIEPGDSVAVKREGIVYVLGAVTRPGGYLMQEDGTMNSTEALALAQGMVLEAHVGSARVIRTLPDGSLEEIPIRFSKGMRAKAQPIPLQPRDIVYVDQSLAKNILTTAKSIVGSATSAVIYAYR